MRYLVTTENYAPFLTDHFEPEHHFNKGYGMVVYDLSISKYTTDGINWLEIQMDHL